MGARPLYSREQEQQIHAWFARNWHVLPLFTIKELAARATLDLGFPIRWWKAKQFAVFTKGPGRPTGPRTSGSLKRKPRASGFVD